jgi:hypothetical protein
MTGFVATTWCFQNRILLGDKPLHSDAKQQVLSDDGTIKVTLEVALGANFTESTALALRGVGYSSSDEAHRAGRIWRQHVAMAFAKGVLGADLDPLPLPGPRPSTERPVDPAAPGLVVYPSGIRFEGLAGGHAERPIDAFITDLADVRESVPAAFPDRADLELAFRMFHLSLMVSNIDAQYILLVTAVEALIPDKRPKRDDKPLVEALDQLTAYAKQPNQFTGPVREKLLSLLAEAKRQSISEIGMRIARRITDRTYNDLSPDAYFQRAYGIRSRLVHGGLDGQAPVDRQMVFEDTQVLRRFVADLLATETGHRM